MADNARNQHVMISYNWDHQEEVLRIKQALGEKGYQIWFDLDKMAGDIHKSMAEAVQGASEVLLCVTEAYKKSENGMREAKFAADLKKKIIPLKLEKDVQFDDWIGPITAGKLWLDFSDERNFRKMIINLERELTFAGVKKRNKDETGHECKVTVLGTQESGAEPGQFNWPNGLAWHGDELLVCDTDNHRIQIFDKNNVVSFIRFDGQFQKPFRPVTVAITPEGHLVIADVGNRQIIICDKDRQIIQIISRNADENVDNINYMAGFVYGIDWKSGRLLKYSVKEGKLLAQVKGQLAVPHYVAPTPNNHLLVSDERDHVIRVFDSDLNFLNSYCSEGVGNGQVKNPRGIDTDSRGNIYICDSMNDRVVKLGPVGQFIRNLFEGDVTRPHQIAVKCDVTTHGDVTRIAVMQGDKRMRIHQIKVYSVLK